MLALNDLLFAHGGPIGSALIKEEPEDFKVSEQLKFIPSGEGEHIYLYIEKKLLTTQDLVKAISQCTGVARRDIGYAGLKDKFAVTKQWISFSENLIKTENWENVIHSDFTILCKTKHNKKCHQSMTAGNNFNLKILNISGDQQLLEERLDLISKQGVPNYFTEQRFGRNGKNIEKAIAMFNEEFRPQKFERGMLLSAARSYLFNLILSKRIENKCWDSALANDFLMHQDSNSLFKVDVISDDLIERIENKTLCPTASLFGEDNSYLPIEDTIYEENKALVDGLLAFKLKNSQRRLRLLPQNMFWEWENSNTLQLQFFAQNGEYATAVCREMFSF